MPKGMNYGKAKRSAQRNNDMLNKDVLADPQAIFGRIMKPLGNARFRVNTTDNRGYPIEADASIRGNSVRIATGDIVVLGRNESAGKVIFEIMGSCDKKTVKQLRDSKRIHSSLVTEADLMDDDLFDRDDEGGEETEEPTKPSPAAAKTAAKDEEVDLDEI
jgi:translation initiation factor IF-1